MSELFYDDALPEMVRILRTSLSVSQIEENLFLRDPSGLLTFVVVTTDIQKSSLAELNRTITAKLYPYVDNDGFAIATPDELFDDTLVISAAFVQPIKADGAVLSLRMIDRRIVGADWLQVPASGGGIPRFVFASLKGGVGRSTALCVAAAALASAGRRVLAIDMDVEAPGLGSMLLSEQTLPPLGLLDYLVETNFGRSADDLFDLLTAPSWLSHGSGVIDVIPALGVKALSTPQSVLSKVSRAYLSHENAKQGVTARMQQLLRAAEATLRYDVILVDARAGLHETTGAALLGLGAQLLFFGTYQPQTFQAYKLLFSNLALAAGNQLNGSISVIHAKAPANAVSRAEFAKQMQDLLKEATSAITSDDRSTDKIIGFEVDWETDEEVLDNRLAEFLVEEDQAPAVVHILESELFRDFDPLTKPEALSAELYRAVYGGFVDHIFRLGAVDAMGVEDE